MANSPQQKEQLQAFKDPYTSGIILIPTRLDKTGEHVVLWRDIQSTFENVKRIMLGNKLVPLLIDDNLELSYAKRGAAAVLHQLSDLVTATTQVMDKHPDTQSPMQTTGTRQSLQQLGQLVERSSGSVSISGKLDQRSTMNTQDDQRVTVQDATFHVCQKMLENQQQILNYQIILQNEVQIAARQTFELLENVIPRLFVVLPKPRRRRDAILKPFRKQFRLFFLCDCGSHTESGRHTYRHEIHLAMHEGYDLDNVDEFFKKYGSYALTIMKILKIGFTVAGVAVPGLSHLGIVQGIDSTAKTLDMASRNCRPLIEDTITSLRSRIKGDNKLAETSKNDQMDFNNLKALYGSDLRQLESFLRHHDPGRDLGNLNRMVTRDGDVRWVCNHHYRTEKGREAIQNFMAILKANNGGFSEPNGSVRVAVKSPDQAKELYEAMVKTPGIRHLWIHLKWPVTQEDLEVFEAAATKAGMPGIELEAKDFEKPGPVHRKNNKKCHPLVQLMCNGHLESMRIWFFGNFYQRVSKIPLMMKSRLQELFIGSIFSPDDRTQRSALQFILGHSPCLRKLGIVTSDSCGVFDFLKDLALRFPNLETITCITLEGEYMMTLSQGKIQDFKMTISRLNDIFLNGRKMIQQGHFTTLDIRQAIDESTWPQVANILRNNPRIAYMELRIHPCLIATITELVATVRKSQITEETSSAGLNALKASVDWKEDDYSNNASAIKITLDFPKNLANSDMSIELRMESAIKPEIMEHILRLTREYGWSIEILRIDRLSMDDFAIALDNATLSRGSKIKSLDLCSRSFTFSGLECMDRVIERSHNMTHLGFTLLQLGNRAERQKAIHLLRRHSRALHSLRIAGKSLKKWMSSSRQCLERLKRTLSARLCDPMSIMNLLEPMTGCTADHASRPLHQDELIASLQLMLEDIEEIVHSLEHRCSNSNERVRNFICKATSTVQDI
ncbi:hypothetical protein BGX34_010657 [Mortierella sp. NVP85]|nr:hypothetical protein BGX34_010657 [Mortierella sp. NVP85]